MKSDNENMDTENCLYEMITDGQSRLLNLAVQYLGNRDYAYRQNLLKEIHFQVSELLVLEKIHAYIT